MSTIPTTSRSTSLLITSSKLNEKQPIKLYINSELMHEWLGI
jgi:hypothetical protein